jgi:hypothetical protein
VCRVGHCQRPVCRGQRNPRTHFSVVDFYVRWLTKSAVGGGEFEVSDQSTQSLRLDGDDPRIGEYPYAYFVSFAYDRGFGNSHILRKTPVLTWADADSLRRPIEDDYKSTIVILNWIQVEPPESTESTAETNTP